MKKADALEVSRKQAAHFHDPHSHVGSLLAWVATLSEELRGELFKEIGKRYHKDGRVKIRFVK